MRYALFYIICITSINTFSDNVNAQDPVLLETVNQDYVHNENKWEDKTRIEYAFDQQGNMIGKNRYNLEVCDDEDPDCSYNMDPFFSHAYERWKYNERGKKIHHSEENYSYTSDPSGNLRLIRTKKYYQKTVYNQDSLVLERETYEERRYSYDDPGQVDITKEHHQYDEQRRLLVDAYSQEYIYDSERSGWNWRTTNEYVGDLLHSTHHVTKHFSNNDTTDIQISMVDFHYNERGLLEYKTIENSSYSRDYFYAFTEREVYSYNTDELTEGIEYQYFDKEAGQWVSTSNTSFSYYDSGEKKTETHRRRYNLNIPAHGQDTILVSITHYDALGREKEWSQTIYEHDGTFIEELNRATYEWYNLEDYKYTSWSPDYIFSYAMLHEYNADNKLTNYRFEWHSYLGDSTVENSHLSSTSYEYDPSGSLVRKHETRVAYDADSLILSGCCGSFYESEEVYENRCDGVPLTITREMWIYLVGTPGEFYPEPRLTRRLNKYGKALCEFSEGEAFVLHVYPNPTRAKVTIESDLFSRYGTEMELVSMNGDIVRHGFAPVTGSMQMNFTGVTAGIYILKLKNAGDQVSGRIVLY